MWNIEWKLMDNKLESINPCLSLVFLLIASLSLFHMEINFYLKFEKNIYDIYNLSKCTMIERVYLKISLTLIE